MATIVVMGALDTKGAELHYVKEHIEARGHRALVIDTGVMGDPVFTPDVSRLEIATAAGSSIDVLVSIADRGTAVTTMADGARIVALRLLEQRQLDAIIAMGGGAGTAVGTSAMRALPLGIPKVMVSTLASGDVSGFLGTKDIVMFPAILDISGLNGISRGVFTRAAAAICGMVEARVPKGHDKPAISASMFGNTTKCVEAARRIFEAQGYEVMVFHAVGSGGMLMESLIEVGHITGVFDATLTEWADELVGGVMSAGPMRLEAAARTGTPAVIAPGCLDIVNFWAPETLPEKHRHRRLYQHNPKQTLVRTDPAENDELGRIIAGKLNLSTGPVAVYLPLRGISVLSSPGNPYHWPEADAALFESLHRHLRSDIPIHDVDLNINDPEFAGQMAEGLLAMVTSLPSSSRQRTAM